LIARDYCVTGGVGGAPWSMPRRCRLLEQFVSV